MNWWPIVTPNNHHRHRLACCSAAFPAVRCLFQHPDSFYADTPGDLMGHSFRFISAAGNWRLHSENGSIRISVAISQRRAPRYCTRHICSPLGGWFLTLPRHVVSRSAGGGSYGDDRRRPNIISRHRGGNSSRKSSPSRAVIHQRRIRWDGISNKLLAHDSGNHSHIGHGITQNQDAVEDPGGRSVAEFA